MSFPFRSTNMGGTSAVQPSTLSTGLLVPMTPAPFAIFSGGVWALSDAIPPYGPGTSSFLQDPDGTRYWLGFGDDQTMIEHSWGVKVWEFRGDLRLSFYDSPPQDIVLADTFGDEPDYTDPPRNLCVTPGSDYLFEVIETPTMIPSATLPGPGYITPISPLDNTSGWLDTTFTSVPSKLRWNMTIRLGRAKWIINGPRAEAFVNFIGEIGDVFGDVFYAHNALDLASPDPVLQPLFVRSTSAWRIMPDDDPMKNGEVTVRRSISGTPYAGCSLATAQPLSFANPAEMGLTLKCYWHIHQTPRDPI